MIKLSRGALAALTLLALPVVAAWPTTAGPVALAVVAAWVGAAIVKEVSRWISPRS